MILSQRKGMYSKGEDHWSVRVAAADAVACICRQFGGKYVDLQQRICRQLASALTDDSKPITTHYGGCLSPQLHTCKVLSSSDAALPEVQNKTCGKSLACTAQTVFGWSDPPK